MIGISPFGCPHADPYAWCVEIAEVNLRAACFQGRCFVAWVAPYTKKNETEEKSREHALEEWADSEVTQL